MSTRVASAHLDVTASTKAALTSLQTLARQASTALQSISAVHTVRVDTAPARAELAGLRAQATRDPLKISLKLDTASVIPDLATVRGRLSTLALQLQNLFKIDTTALGALSTTLGKQITDLRAIENALRTLGGAGRGSGGGAGGGGPGLSSGYGAQLRALQGDLRAGSLSTTAFEQATRNLLATINSEIVSLRALGPLTADQSRKLDGLRAAAGQASQALGRVGQSGSAGIQKLQQELQVANSRFERGDLSLRAYLREMQRLQAAGQGLASGLAAGSREAAQLERVMQGLSRSSRGLNDTSITKIRADLAAARAEFERATVAAGRFGNTRAATQAYETQMRALEQRIQAVGQRTNVTAGQLRSLNQLSAQLGSQRNALQGGFTQIGLAGSVVNALRAVLPVVQQLSPNLGAAANGLNQLGGGLRFVGPLLNPVGLAIGAIGAAAIAATAGLVSLARTGLAEIQGLQRGLNILQANGVSDLRAIQTEINALQASLGTVSGAFTRAQLTQATADIVKAGVSSKDALTLLASSTRLAAAEQIGLNEASGLLLKNLRQYGLPMTDAAKAGDMLAKAGNLAAGTANDLSIGLGIVGGTGKQAKIEMYDLLGMLVELDNKGMNAADVGANGLRAAIASLSDVTVKGRGVLHGLGIATEDAAGKARPAGDIMKDLGAKMRSLGIVADKTTGELSGNGEALRTVSSIMDNRAAAALINLTGDWKGYGDQIRNSRGELVNYSTIMQQGLQPALLALSNAWKDTGSALAAKFVGPLASVFNTVITPGIKTLGAFIERLQTSAATSQLFGQVFTGVGQALSAFGGVVQQVFLGIQALWESVLSPVLRVLGSAFSVILQAASAALTLLLSVVGGVFQGVAAAITALLGNFGVGESGIRLSLAGIADSAVRGAGVARLALVALGRFAGTLPDVFRLAGTGIGTVLAGIGRTLQGFGQGARAVFVANGGYVSAYAQAVGRAAQNVGLIVRGLAGVFGALALALRNALVERAGRVLAAGIQLYGTFSDGVNRVLTQVAGGFFRYVVQPVQAGANFLAQAYNRVSGIVAGAANRISGILAPIGNVLKALGLSIGDTLAGLAQAAVSRAAGIVDAFAGGAQAAYTRAQVAAQQAATTTATTTANGVATALNGASRALGDFARDNGAGQALDAALGQVKTGLAGVSQGSVQLRGDFAAVAGTLKTDLGGAARTVSAGLADVRTGAQLTGAALDLVQRNAQDAVQGFTQDVKTLGQTAKATATAIQGIKPPTVNIPRPAAASSAGPIPVAPVKKAKAAPVTAADLNALDQYKDSLRNLTPQQLASAKADAIRTNNKKHLNAILAEEARRQREATSAGKAAATQSRQQSAELERETLTRANLVREIRQGIAAFKLQSDQGKVTAASLLAFRQRMEDLRARMATLPPALQAGTQALFDQASALASSARVHETHGRAVALSGAALIKYREALRGKSAEQLKALELEARTRNLGPQLSAVLAEQSRRLQLSGVALTKYKEALRGKSAAQLKDLETDARARSLGPQLTAILAERTRRVTVQAAADKKAAAEAVRHAQAAGTLERSTRQLNERFALQVSQGKVSEEGLLRYRQALDTARTTLATLPPALRGSVAALLTQGQTLAAQGQGVITHRSEIEKLRGEIDKWTLAELENGRARVLAGGGDPAKLKLLDAEISRRKTLSDAQAQQARTESRLALAQSGQGQAEGDLDTRRSQARGNLATLYALELQFGARVQAARDAAARATAEDEERQIRERYGRLLALEGLSTQRRRELEDDRDRELTAAQARLSTALTQSNQTRLDAELDAKRNLDEALLGVDRETRDRLRAAALQDLKNRTADVEAAQQQELDAEDLTETQRLEIRRRNLPLLLAAKQAEVDQSRVIEQQAETDRYSDAVKSARAQGLLDQQRLQPDGTTLTVAQELEQAHQAELLRIGQGFAREYRDYELAAKRETGRQVLATEKATSANLKEEADGRVETVLTGLDDMTGAQRTAARAALEAWRISYAGQGQAGQAAVAQIDAALKKLAASGDAARRKAAELVVDPVSTSATFDRKLGSIGKPDDLDAARDKAEQQFEELYQQYVTGIAQLRTALSQFAGQRDQDLTPDEVKTRNGLQATLALYSDFLLQTKSAALDAGTQAATAFTQAQSDQAATSALALVEAQKELADAEGRDGSPAYLAGLQAALAYWRARLLGLAQGTPDYLDALKRITELEGKLAGAKGDPLQERLSSIAQAVGKNGPLQKSIGAGLDGLGAYFKAGGAKGGRTSVIAGAQALVAGLADVFKTGDEDVDQALGTFVSGVQATLGQLAKGDWVGALITGVATLVSTLIDLFTGGANSAKKAAEQIGEATKGIRFFDVSKYARVVSRGGFLGFFGFKKSEIDKEALDVARTLGDSIYEAISGGLLDGIRSGKATFAELGLDIKKSLAQNILQGLIDGFLQGEVMKNIIQPFLDRFIAARNTADPSDDVAAANDLQNAITRGNSELQLFYDTILVPAAKGLGAFGTDAPAGGASSQPSQLGGNASLQLGIPRLEASFPDGSLRGLTDFRDLAVPEFRSAVAEQRLATGELRALIASSRGLRTPPPLSNSSPYT